MLHRLIWPSFKRKQLVYPLDRYITNYGKILQINDINEIQLNSVKCLYEFPYSRRYKSRILKFSNYLLNYPHFLNPIFTDKDKKIFIIFFACLYNQKRNLKYICVKGPMLFNLLERLIWNSTVVCLLIFPKQNKRFNWMNNCILNDYGTIVTGLELSDWHENISVVKYFNL